MKPSNKENSVLRREERRLHQEEKRARSSSFSARPGSSSKQTEYALKKGQSLSVLGPKRRDRGLHIQDDQQPVQGAEAPVTPDIEVTSHSLSGSFLSLGFFNSPKHHRSWGEVTNSELLSENDFDGHFKSARSLSGSNLKYEFPSPMHAILLHYDKTSSPVLSQKGNIGNKLDENKKARRASFSGPVGRRLSRQEMTYKLRKDSSLGDLPLCGNYITPVKGDTGDKESSTSEADQGVSAFIEMLASRGQARRRQEDRDRKRRMLDTLGTADQKASDKQGAEGRQSADTNTGVRTSSSDPSGTDPSRSADGDSGQWEGSNLSSSGKRGSHVSLRSSASSKASLSSEEGYYSHPGSPHNQHAQNRFSIQSSASLASAGSFSFYQSEFSDEDLLESPQGKPQDPELPESPTSSDTMTPSSCGTVEILDLQNSPGAKRRFSSCSLPSDSKDEQASQLTLPRTSTPIRDTAAKSMSLPRETVDHASPPGAVRVTVTKVKSSSPIDIVRKQDTGLTDTSRGVSVSPGMSFLTSFEMRLSPGSPKADSADLSSSPGSKKDSASWGKLLPDPPRLSPWRQVSPKGDSPVGGRSRFEGPRTPTIKEEPNKEEQLAELAPRTPPPALQPLSISPTRDNVVMLSPPICKAPKVPSWRKQNKIAAIELDENSSGGTCAAASRVPDDNTAPVKREPLPCKQATQPEKSVTKRHSTSLTINITQKKPEKKDCRLDEKRPSDSQPKLVKTTERQEKRDISDHEKHKHVKQKRQSSSIKITVTSEPEEGGKADIRKKTSTVRVHRENSQRKSPLKHNEKPSERKVSSPRKILLEPPPGREYISRNPKSDANNVFQYPSLAEKPPSSPKTPTAKDIQEILKNWVEARTPGPADGKTDLKKEKEKDQSLKVSTLPRGFRASGPPLTPTLPVTVREGEGTLKRAKRLYHSQELHPKDTHKGRDIPKLTAVNSHKQDQLNNALNENHSAKIRAKSVSNAKVSSRVKNTELPKTSTVMLPKAKVHEHSSPGSCSDPPSLVSQTAFRPRSHTWSRGQPASEGRSSRNAWVREIVVPPSTPTCKTEAKIYEGRKVQADTPSKANSDKDNANSRLQWFKPCPEIKDTFV